MPMSNEKVGKKLKILASLFRNLAESCSIL